MGRTARDRIAEKLSLASWLISSRLTLDDAVETVAAVARHADDLRDLVPPAKRRPAWVQRTEAYISALAYFVGTWRDRFADADASWDEARLRFVADVAELRDARAVLVDYLAGRPHTTAAVPEPTPAPQPRPADPAPPSIEQPVNEAPAAEEQQAQDDEPKAGGLPWPSEHAPHQQEQEEPAPVEVDQDANDTAVSLWPGFGGAPLPPQQPEGGAEIVDFPKRQAPAEPAEDQDHDAEPAAIEPDASPDAEAEQPTGIPLLPPPLSQVAAYTSTPAPKPYRAQAVPRPPDYRRSGGRARMAVMAGFVAAAVAGAGYVAVAASGSTKPAAAATHPTITPRPSTAVPTTPSTWLSTPALGPSTSSTAPSIAPAVAPKAPPPPVKTTTTVPSTPTTTRQQPAPTTQAPRPTTAPPPRPTTTRPPSSSSVTGITVSISGGDAGTALYVHVHVTTSGTGSVTVSATVAGSQNYGSPGSAGRQGQSKTVSGSTSYDLDFSFDGFAFCGSPYVGAQASAGGHGSYAQQSNGC